MQDRIAGRIVFAEGVDPPSSNRFFVQAKLPDDAHPYGQWSIVVERGGSSYDRVYLNFVAPEAPHNRLVQGAQFELFRGALYVGAITITGRATFL